MIGLFLVASMISGCANDSLQDRVSLDVASSAKICDGLLSHFGVKLPELEFESCTKGSGQVIRSARYKVRGTQAATVEESLHKQYGMGRLTFVCCGWEPAEGRTGMLRAPSRDVSVTMNSEETLLSDRTEWSNIPFFYVTFEELDI